MTQDPRNGSHPRAAIPEVVEERGSAPVTHPPPFTVARVTAWAGIAKIIVTGAMLVIGAISGAVIVARQAASMRDVDQAERRAIDRAGQMVEGHAIGGPHVSAAQLAQAHEVRLQALERELDWQATALALIADRLKVKLPPRPKHGALPP